MQKHISFSDIAAVVIPLAVAMGCSGPVHINPETQSGEFVFSVFDVGQGLSQAGVMNTNAVIWDVGDTGAFTNWCDGYARIGSPYIKAIVISHGDRDHMGNLQLLPPSLRFSGTIITSPYEDTAALRNCAAAWSSTLRFHTVAQGDTLALLDNVYVACLWPPRDSASNQWITDNFDKNRFSLCFKLVHGNTSVLITSDIDTIAAEKLTATYTRTLSSDIVVVPHHGSRGSLHARFYGYINPERAVISCGMHNPYGHPADDVVKFLAMQMLVTVNDTRFDGHVTGRSNREYWVW